MSEHRGPKERLSQILGLCDFALTNAIRDPLEALREIRAEAHAAIAEMGAEERACSLCCDEGVYVFGDGDAEPCDCQSAALREWNATWRRFGTPAEVRSWLAARKAPGADGVRDESKPAGERRTA